MRAIFHLELFDRFRSAGSFQTASCGQCSINGMRFNESKHHARKFLVTRINRLQASQNAAALLIDPGTSIFAEWGLVKANTRRGVFRVKQPDRRAFAGNDESRPGLGSLSPKENGMKDATRRAASEVLAQMLAVTAMLVIASFVFYTR